ncbi:sensor histidine kinase [bacterium 1xD8-6]|jgi:Osmosensitive K+ channel histidine kinase|nr:sensor histidine kinase [bacterium D16-36]RKI72998.1 sensor histidine kinase [bacterium 1xD8-6]
MAELTVWAVCASAAALFLLFKLRHFKRGLYEFTGHLEQWFDDIIMEKELGQAEKEEDTLGNKIYEKLCRINHIFQRKGEENQREKEAIKELVSDISHQTKTPIANMKVYLEILKEEPLSDQGKAFLGNLESQADKLDFLFQNMVKMSRLETGIIRIQKERASLSETLGRAVAAVVPEAEKKRIQIFVKCAEEIMISHDKKWTEEAVFNILDNAVKYTEEGGKIEIEVSVLEIYTRISIKDSGKGIAVERQAEIFNRFYREPEVNGIEGIGIGLYLARKIIEMQNGYIEVRSQINRGSDFRIYLLNEFSQ